MPDRTRRRLRLYPRHGIMATEAGRRVVRGVLLLTVVSMVAVGVVIGVGTLVALTTGAIRGDEAVHLLVGVFGGVLALGGGFALLPLLGRLTGLGDDIRLLELCDPGAPLLHELMESAPGTYAHSVMVGSLAEAAAHQIGANALLARAGAYYHDIGKLSRPQFFAENQSGLRNPHDSARPEQSAFIITAHVRDGAMMAERGGLPQPVVDIIAQHHGTSLVTYFYRKASSCGLLVDEAPFRYEEELPSTREAALVMLADSAEAAGRALADCGPVQIEAAVRKVVKSKRDDGQLERSGMSDEDVEETIAVYAKMLSGQRHTRVGYPEVAERT